MAYAFEGGVSTDPVDGAVEITPEQYQAAISAIIDGKEITIDGGFTFRDRQPSEHHVWENGEWVDHTPEPEPPAPPTLGDYKAAFDGHLDAVAQERQYDNRVTIATYKGSTNPQWASEAEAYIAWRDAALLYMFSMLEDWQSGEIEQPTVEAFVAGITPIVWPE